jgi:hypothetical protein
MACEAVTGHVHWQGPNVKISMSEVFETKFNLSQGHINLCVEIPLLFPTNAQG